MLSEVPREIKPGSIIINNPRSISELKALRTFAELTPKELNQNFTILKLIMRLSQRIGSTKDGRMHN
jgi:hypothetical protein